MLRFLAIISVCLILPNCSFCQDQVPFSNEKELEVIQNKLSGLEIEGPADSVGFYYQKQAALYRQLDRLEDWLYSYWDLQAYYYEEAPKAIEALQTALTNQWRAPVDIGEWEALLWIYTNLGYQTFQLGKVLASARAYEKAAEIFERHRIPEFEIVNYVYLPLGAHYTRLGDNERARAIYRKALTQTDLSADLLGGLHNNLGLTYWDEGDFAKAEQQFETGLAVADLPPLKKALLLINQGLNLYDLGQLEGAEKAARQAIDILDSPGSANKSIVLDYQSGAQALLGSLASQRQDLAESELWFAKALKNGIAALGTPIHRTIGKIYVSLSKARLNNGKPKEALNAANLALQSVLQGYQPKSPEALPDAELLYEENTLIEALDVKAEALTKLGAQTGETALLMQALQCYELASGVEDLLNRTFQYESARLLLQAKGRNRTEKALSITYQLREEPGMPSRALALAEKNKSTVLLAAIRDNLVRREIAQGNSLLSQERAWRRLRAYYQKELIMEKEEIRQIRLEQQLAETGDSLAQLEQTLQQRYPQLAQLDRFRSNPVEASGGALLSRQGLLLEFFYGREQVFAFRQNSIGETQMIRIASATPLRDSLMVFLRVLRSRDALSVRQADFGRMSASLYQQLLAPHLKEGVFSEELTIIPDGPLVFLAFETLLSAIPENQSWSEMPFALKQFTIRYGYSIATLMEQTGAQHAAQKNMLEIAPGFSERERGLSPLRHSNLDFRKAGIKDVEVWSDTEANLQNLENEVGNFKILHFSTHARVDSQNQQPQIELIDAPMYLPQLYALELQADLVTLSACETGLGSFLEGEGVMSLARGFAYAGAASLISSQWAVNEQATSHIFDRFYKHLANRQAKDQALQQAKLDYLQSDVPSFQKSPYYWAGFLFLGDNRAVDLHQPKSNGNAILFFLLIIVVIILFFLARKRRQRFSPNS